MGAEPRSDGRSPSPRRLRSVARPPAGAPNVVVIVLDDLGFAQLGCFGSDIATPAHRRARRAAGCATTASTSRRCARRPAPACSPGATTTRSAWASSPTSRSASPATTARIPTIGRGTRRGSCATRATARSRSASGTSRPAGSRARRARSTAGRSASASSATTASSAATPTSGRPSSCRDNGFVEPPRTPDEGYHLTEDLADRAIRDRPGPAAGDARQAVLPLLRDRRDARAAPRAARVDRALPRPFRRGLGGVARRRLRPPARARASCPPARRSPIARAGCAAWDGSPTDERRLFARHDGGVRRLPQPHRPPDRAARRLPRRARRRSTTPCSC